MKNEFLENFINFLKNEGFIFQSNEIYGGTSGFYDFGPLGSLIKINIKNLWLQDVVFNEKNIFLIETSLINPKIVFEASGHLENFFDILVECKNCHLRFKKEESKNCPQCGSNNLTRPKKFNLMFQTKIGSTGKTEGYLRPETAQGIFVNFLNVLSSTRSKLPLGIASIGKSFRNEINPRNFIFRLREFEQMELEFFVKPNEADYWFNYWLEKRYNWYLKIGIKKENLKKVEIPKNELPHYSKKNVDIHYNFPFGFQEIEGIANRGDYDLQRHSKFSSKKLTYYDQKEKKSYFPYVIEPSAGVERIVFAILIDSIDEDEIDGKKRFVLRLNSKVAPLKFAILPLVSNKKEIVNFAKNLYEDLRKKFVCVYDENGSIGRRYRRQDEIGTPWCITVDFESLTKKDVTVRDRDTTEQIRIKIEDIERFFEEKLK